jgi:diguanylate cyclase (GGDEF)-like protein/PAS domain S-box-containing protein
MPELLTPEVFRIIVNESDAGLYVVDRERRIRYWNRGAEQITGFLAQNVMGRCCRENILVHCDEHERSLCGEECPLTDAMRDGIPHKAQVFLRHREGHRIPVEVHVIPLRDASGIVVGAAEWFIEHAAVPEFSSQTLVYAACGVLDEETGVPNRDLSESYLREQLDLFEKHHIPFAVFVVRADHLSDFQQQHGYEAAVAILAAVARTLRHSLRTTDFVGRWGEDRFVMILPYSGRTPLETAVQRLRSVVNSTAIPWWGDLISIRVSAGLVEARDGDSAETLKARIEHCLDRGGIAAEQPGTGA